MALTFIFSGFVKGMDPLGTQYKITDYLEALHIDWMFPSWATLGMSVLLSTCEFAIGIFLLFAIRRRLVSKIAHRAEQRSHLRQEHRAARHRHPAVEKAALDAKTHLEVDTMDCHQLYIPLLHHHESVESVVSTAV